MTIHIHMFLVNFNVDFFMNEFVNLNSIFDYCSLLDWNSVDLQSFLYHLTQVNMNFGHRSIQPEVLVSQVFNLFQKSSFQYISFDIILFHFYFGEFIINLNCNFRAFNCHLEMRIYSFFRNLINLVVHLHVDFLILVIKNSLSLIYLQNLF